MSKISFLLGLLLLTACSLAPTQSPTGVLKGKVSVGPLQPVERAGELTPTPNPEVYTSRSITIYQADGKTRVTTVAFSPDGTYHVELPAGSYMVSLTPLGIDFSKDLPAEVVIQPGATTTLDINIDTGIR